MISGCSTAVRNSEQSNGKPTLKPFLYSASLGSRRWFIFGTMHFGISISELPDFVIRNFTQSPVVVFESVDREEDFDKLAGPLYRHSEREKALKQETIAALKQRGIRDGLIKIASRGALCRFYQRGPNASPNEILDLSFVRKAREQNKVRIGLDEPSAEYVKVTSDSLDACNPDELVKVLSPTEAKANIENELSIYRKGDLKKFSEGDDFSSADIRIRNLSWMKKLKKISEPNVFIIVGLSHLPGETGLLKLLAQEGYSITQVNQ